MPRPQHRRFPVAAAILFAASLLLFAAGGRGLAAVYDASAHTSAFTLTGAGITHAEAKAAERAALEQGPLGALAFWSQVEGYTAVNPHLETTADVSVVSIEGDARLVMPGLDAYPRDASTCVLSSAASTALFGQPDAAGLTVKLAGATFEVVDTVVDDEALLVKTGDETTAYARLTARASDADGFPVTEELVEAALDLRVEALDYRGLALLLYLCLFAYPLTLVMGLLPLCSSRRGPARISPVVRLACMAAAACGAVGATTAFAASLAAFGDYFPTRWADLTAWRAAVQAWGDSLAALAFSRQTAFDQPTAIAAAATMLCAGAAVVALIAAVRQLRWHAVLARAEHASRESAPTSRESR